MAMLTEGVRGERHEIKEEEQIVETEVYTSTLKSTFLQTMLDQLEVQDKKTSFGLSFMPFSRTPVDHEPNCKMRENTQRSSVGLGLSAEFSGLTPEADLEEDKLVIWVSPE